jgi:hypothetical protein
MGVLVRLLPPHEHGVDVACQNEQRSVGHIRSGLEHTTTDDDELGRNQCAEEWMKASVYG